MGDMRHRRVLACLFLGALTAIFAGCGGEKEVETARIFVTSTPVEGARVTVGQLDFGPTPAVVTGMPAGQTYVTLTMDGYKRVSEVVQVPATGEVRLTVEMTPLTGTVSIESNPPGAEVYLDGPERIGETPIEKYAMHAGTRKYTLRMENYEPVENTIEVQEDYVYNMKHDLIALPAELQVVSRPTGAEIRINGQLQKEVSPAKFSLAPGSYSVSAYMKGFVEAEQTIVLGPNSQASTDLVLAPGFVPPGMVLIPAGDFVRGASESPDERPKTTLFVEAFYMDKFEVTNEEFKKVFPAHVFENMQANWPVTGVTWKQAMEYAQAVGKRLPKEIEWEKAARGADGRDYPWGNTFEEGAANCMGGKNAKAKPVGTHRNGASPFGVMDMAGNAYEWTADWYEPYPGNQDINTKYGQIYRVLRGGSFKSEMFDVRAPRRMFDLPDAANADYGFRCAMDVEAAEALGQQAAPRAR